MPGGPSNRSGGPSGNPALNVWPARPWSFIDSILCLIYLDIKLGGAAPPAPPNSLPMTTVPANSFDISNDFSDLSAGEEEINGDRCHVCFLPRTQNFALLHDQYVHGGFCESCSTRLLELNANCQICRNKINGVLKIFQ